MATKSIVDGLQQQYGNRVHIVRVDLLTSAGRELGARYDFWTTPHFVGFDRQGKVVWTQRTSPPNNQMIDQLLN